MARTKPKKRAQSPAAANDPTPERMARDVFAIVDAPRMADEHVGRDRIASTRKQVSRVKRMEQDRWIDAREADALERYELLIEQAGYAASRSCLDMTPRGGCHASVIDRLAAARQLLARARNAVGTGAPLLFVDAVLSPFGSETVTDVMDRMLHGARRDRRDIARAYVVQVAGSLAMHFGR